MSLRSNRLKENLRWDFSKSHLRVNPKAHPKYPPSQTIAQAALRSVTQYSVAPNDNHSLTARWAVWYSPRDPVPHSSLGLLAVYLCVCLCACLCVQTAVIHCTVHLYQQIAVYGSSTGYPYDNQVHPECSHSVEPTADLLLHRMLKQTVSPWLPLLEAPAISTEDQPLRLARWSPLDLQRTGTSP